MTITNIASYAARLDDLRVVTLTDGEVWSARDLMPFAGYADWRNWSKAIDRAIASVNASGLDGSDHFVGSNKMVDLGSGGRRQVEDVEITRYGAYILFQNADASKPQIAAAQQYFAVQTRHQELAAPAAFDPTSLDGARALIAAAQTALDALAVAQPKAAAWDELASADGDLSVGEAAKILARADIHTGPQRLFDQLADFHWIFRNGHGVWEPYAAVVDRGYLTLKPMSHEHPKTRDRIIDAPQVRVTVRGLDHLRTRLQHTSAAPVPERGDSMTAAVSGIPDVPALMSIDSFPVSGDALRQATHDPHPTDPFRMPDFLWPAAAGAISTSMQGSAS